MATAERSPTGTVTEQPVPRWVEAVFVRWDEGLDGDPALVDRMLASFARCSIRVHLLAAPPTRAPPTATAHRDADPETVAAALELLAGDGLGPGLLATVGRLPGLPPSVLALPGGVTSLRTLAHQQLTLRRTGHVPSVDADPSWTLELHGRDPALCRVEESLGALGDTRAGLRASRAESGPRCDPMLLLAGCYEDGEGTGAAATPTLLPGPLWTGLRIASSVAGPGRRVLDLRCGLLLRDGDATRALRELRLLSLARPGLGLLRAQGPHGALVPGPELQAPPPGTTRDCEVSADTTRARTSSRRASIEVVARSRWVTSEAVTGVERRVAIRGGRLVDPPAPHTVDHRPPPQRTSELDAELEALEGQDFAALLAEHRAAWARRWRHADVVVEGDTALTRDIRFCLFHLMAAVPDTGEAAVGARGLTGRAYRGHVFWDADVFVLPFLAATHPSAARAMLAYRVARLPAARAAARAAGRAGARFPWESADDGTEVTPATAIGPDGRLAPVLSRTYQEHITADIAWAADHYLDWTGDRAFARTGGLALLDAAARYWHSRAEHDADGRAHIRGVMGPDEYHAPVDDNAYTNSMARWTLRRAAAHVEATSEGAHQEAAAWRRTAAALVDGYDPTLGRHEQFAGYDDLDDVPLEEVATPPVAADVVLGPARTAATQIIKQADVLMLHHLLPDACPPGSLERDLEHYLRRTAHGSSLSPGIHAALLFRVGRVDDAEALLRLTTRIDLDDLTQTTAGGVHLAAAGSVWQALVLGALGVRPLPDGALAIDPHLPSTWTGLSANLRVRGRVVRVAAHHDRLRVTTDRPLVLALSGGRQLARPPQSTFRPTPRGWEAEP